MNKCLVAYKITIKTEIPSQKSNRHSVLYNSLFNIPMISHIYILYKRIKYYKTPGLELHSTWSYLLAYKIVQFI